MNQRWIQFLLVVVPVMSLIGSWLALRDFSKRPKRRDENAESGEETNEPQSGPSASETRRSRKTEIG